MKYEAALRKVAETTAQMHFENERLRAEALAFAELAMDYIGGPCDDPESNPHFEVWCITHQEKRCTGTADYERAVAYLRVANSSEASE